MYHRFAVWSLVPCLVTGCTALHSRTGETSQTDNIRAQVAKGLQIAEEFKVPVAQVILQRQRQDLTLSTVNTGTIPLPLLPATSPDSVKVANGIIIVTFNSPTYSAIVAKQLALIPLTDVGGGVVWKCGHATTPAGLMVRFPYDWLYTTVEEKYLPPQCRQ